MKVAHEKLNHVVSSANYEGMKYCSVVQVIDDDAVRTELRWARGDKELASVDL
jgi:hypothetical protein